MTMKTHEIEGIKYIETKTVTYKGKKYIKLASANVREPSVLYGEFIDGDFIPINDRDTRFALAIVDGMCILSLHGMVILDYHLGLYEHEFYIENGKLVILNDNKRKIFDKFMMEVSAKGG